MCADILRFMRKMYDGFAALPAAAFHGELGKKMQVTKESLQKVENGACGIDSTGGCS